VHQHLHLKFVILFCQSVITTKHYIHINIHATTVFLFLDNYDVQLQYFKISNKDFNIDCNNCCLLKNSQYVLNIVQKRNKYVIGNLKDVSPWKESSIILAQDTIKYRWHWGDDLKEKRGDV